MPNILQMQEILKGIPDEKLMQEAQQPSGNAPTYLVMSEIERRKKVRDEYMGQVQEQQTTVLEDIVTPAPVMHPPPSGMPMPPPPGQMPPSAPSQMPMPPAPPPSMGMETGGPVYMQTGGGMESVDEFIDMLGNIDRELLARMVEAEAGGESAEGKKAVASVIVNRMLSKNFPDGLEDVLTQKASAGRYQFSPMDSLKGDFSKLGEATDETEDVIEELLADFGNENPVGNALYFQNPNSAKAFPIQSQDKSAGQRVGNHVFFARYSETDVPEDFSPFYSPTAGQVASVDDDRQIARAVADANKNAGLSNLFGGTWDSLKSGVKSLLPSSDDASSETGFVPRGELPDLNIAALQRLGRTTPQPPPLVAQSVSDTDEVIDDYELLVPPTPDTKEQRVADALAKAQANRARIDQERREAGIRQENIRTPSAGNQFVQDMLKKIKAQNAPVYATPQTPQQVYERKKALPSVRTPPRLANIPDAFSGASMKGLSALANLAPDQPYASVPIGVENPAMAEALGSGPAALASQSIGVADKEMFKSNIAGKDVTVPAGSQTGASDGQYAQLLADIAKSQDDAKAMGLLTAGLGIMQQASQPGATFMSSIPGAQAGVKQFTDDKAALAKRQVALATLANQKRATDIAAEKLARGGEYQAYENRILEDYRNSENPEKYFFMENGKPGRVKPNVRQAIRASYSPPTVPDSTLRKSRLESAYQNYMKGDGKKQEREIRRKLIEGTYLDYGKMNANDARIAASQILRENYMRENYMGGESLFPVNTGQQVTWSMTKK